MKKSTVLYLSSSKISVFFRIALSILFITAFFSCASTRTISDSISTPAKSVDFNFLSTNNAEYASDKDFWEGVGDNSEIGYYHYSEKGIKYHCVRISLNQENLKILAYPEEENSKKMRSKKFVSLTGSKIAINTTPYAKDGKILGVHISNGIKLASEIKRYSALYFEKTEKGYVAKISENQSPDDFQNAEAAFGGFFTILKNNEIQTFGHTSYDARSAAGISADGATLFLLSVEKGFFGRGLSYPECAEILKKLGASDALEFDGGDSTSLFVEGKISRTESLRKNSAYMGFGF